MQTLTLVYLVGSILLLVFIILSLVLTIIYAASFTAGWIALSRSYESNNLSPRGDLVEEKMQPRARVGVDQYGRLVTARCYQGGLELVNPMPLLQPLFFPNEDMRDYRRIQLALLSAPGDQFYIGSRRIYLSNHLQEFEKRFPS